MTTNFHSSLALPQRRRTLHMRGGHTSRRPEALSREEPCRPGKMAPPSSREPKSPSATSAAKPDGEMVLPGFPDADSFVKVSSRGFRGHREPPRSAGSGPGPCPRPPTRPRARRCGAGGWGRGVFARAEHSLSLPLLGGDRTRTLRDASFPRALVLTFEPMQMYGVWKPCPRRGKGFLVTLMFPDLATSPRPRPEPPN